MGAFLSLLVPMIEQFLKDNAATIEHEVFNDIHEGVQKLFSTSSAIKQQQPPPTKT